MCPRSWWEDASQSQSGELHSPCQTSLWPPLKNLNILKPTTRSTSQNKKSIFLIGVKKKKMIEIPKLQINAQHRQLLIYGHIPKVCEFLGPGSILPQTPCYTNPVPPGSVSEEGKVRQARKKIFNFPPGLPLTRQKLLSGVCLLLPSSMTGVLRPCGPNTWAGLGSMLCGMRGMGGIPTLLPQNNCSGFEQHSSLPGSQRPTKLLLLLSI